MNLKKYILVLFITCISFSCSDYLDVVPDNLPTIDIAFSDRSSTEKYLATCYSYMPTYGHPSTDFTLLGSDEYWTLEDPYYNGATSNFRSHNLMRGIQNAGSPSFDYWSGRNGGRPFYNAIRDCNVFLENVHNVGGDLSEEEADLWAAETKVLKAFYHFQLMRMYGAIPIIRENFPIAADTDDVRVFREPFDEGIDYIVSLIDEAVPNLPLQIVNVTTELGRVTIPMALTLKALILTTSASPLFNGNLDFAGLVDNRGISLFNDQHDNKKWVRAAQACKSAIDTCLLAGHEFFDFKELNYLSDTTQRLMSLRQAATERWNKEIIWSANKMSTNEFYNRSIPPLNAAQAGYNKTDPYISASLRMVDAYYSSNGVPIDEDPSFDYIDRYTITSAPADHTHYVSANYQTAKANLNREPRFYANVVFDGAIWFGNGRLREIGDPNSSPSEQAYVIGMKRTEPSGKRSGLRHAVTGYWTRKASHYKSVVSESTSLIEPSTFPLMRLSDLYLLYAEALNESLDVPNTDVYEYIDLVRKRAGLKGVVESWTNHSNIPGKPTTKEGMREIIRKERTIELAFEGKRYWDIRRWKTASKWLNQPIRGLNANGETAEDFTQVKTLFVPQFTTKEYLFPIALTDLRTNTNLVQNPGW
ncbi:RagB/SusD family nutrient uptake outer membrane protein [Reichenbachiella sp. MALMAid0571]|uniref:RagB/SusD family nutrient uptake outer membrane protein n=1 Tax=Reichenbachiella sp. MALMAid0571 TaxID=3143939 RepID=UPI0032DE9F4B